MPQVNILSSSIWDSLKPPPKISCAEWADKYLYLSPESSSYAGKFHCFPYQREILESCTPGLRTSGGKRIWRVTFCKSARIGYNKMLQAVIGYHIHQAPTNILIVEPTDPDATDLMKEEFNPMVRDTPILSNLVSTEPSSDGKSRLTHRLFQGGLISAVGAVSPKNFRRISRKIILLDEIDAYKKTLGKEGDPRALAIKRSEDYADRMIIEGSTPAGSRSTSSIWGSYQESDQRKWFVHCPKCGHPQFLRWEKLWWKNGHPATVVYRCEKCDHGINYDHQREMVKNGYWKATAEGSPGHCGYWLNALSSGAPNVTWPLLAEEYEKVKGNTNRYTTFVNTTLGLPWDESEEQEIDAGDILENLDDSYSMGEVPDKVIVLVMTVDVQGGGGSSTDRIEFAIWGYGEGYESWLIFTGQIKGDPQKTKVWEQLKIITESEWSRKDNPDEVLKIKLCLIDSGGHAGIQVEAQCHINPLWEPLKGSGTIDAPILKAQAAPRVKKGLIRKRRRDLWIVGVNRIKDLMYSRLIEMCNNQESMLHFPIELTSDQSEQLVTEIREVVANKKCNRWINRSGRPNELWDLLVYSYAAINIITAKYDPRTVWSQLSKNKTINSESNKPKTPKPKFKGWL